MRTKTVVRYFRALVALVVNAPALASGLAGSEWRPIKIGDLAPPDGADIFVGFKSGGRLSGNLVVGKQKKFVEWLFSAVG